MKQKVVLFAAFALISLLAIACDSSGSSDVVMQTDDPIEPVVTPPALPSPRSPVSTDTLPAPTSGSAWYRFENNSYGMALAGETLTLDGSSFEQTSYYWDGDSWEKFMGLKGSLSPISGSDYNATLEAIYLIDDSGATWHGSSTEEFAMYLSHVWSKASATARVSLAASGTSLAYKRDQDGNGALTDALDFATAFTATPSTTLTGHGKYPWVNYTSWSFHGNTAQASSSAGPDTILSECLDDSASSLVASVVGRAKNQNGAVYGPISYDCVPDGEGIEWEKDYTFADVSYGGLWWLYEDVVTYKNGATVTYRAADPWSHYSATYKTDTGYTGSIADCGLLPGQDYMPPDTAGAGKTVKYIRTLVNGSSGVSREKYTDTKLYLYSEDDTTKWLAVNDDWCSDLEFGDYTLYSTIQYPFEIGKKYLVKVVDINDTEGGYSIILQNDINFAAGVLAGARTTMVSSPDTYEAMNDDSPATTNTLIADTIQHHSLESGDPDWMAITID